MTPVLVNSSVLIDISPFDPVWSSWSAEALLAAGRAARLIVNPLIYAEVSLAHRRVETLESLVPSALFHREDLPSQAAFLAGKAFLAYRRRGGSANLITSDFYIDAHAALCGYRLLTRIRGRYADCYPTLQLIAPE